MPNLVLEGFPHNTKLTRLVFLFKRILRKQNIERFWIKEMSDIRGSNLKSVTVEFYDVNESNRAWKLFHKFQYNNGNDLYPINAHLEFERAHRKSPSPYRYKRDGFDSYSRDRSRSPHYETSKLDLEIELLRKQRLIIEEERKLLLERKKLELVKEFGPSALQEFESSEFSRARHHDYKPRELSPIRSRPKKRLRADRPKTPPNRRMPEPAKKLPNFLWPCKLILKDIRDLILTSGVESKKERSILYRMIRITLRKRLAVLCEGKPIMSAPDLAALYRERYPATADEVLVAKHLKDLRGSHMSIKGGGETGKDTEKGKVKEVGEKPKQKGVETKNEVEVRAGEKRIKIESTNEESKMEQDKQEKSTEVDNVTDTTANNDLKVDIKIETTDIEEANFNNEIENICKDLQSNEEDISNKEENGTNVTKPAKSIDLDDWTGVDPNEIDEANMDDWIDGEGEEWN